MFPSITRCLRKAQYLIENRVKAILNLKSLTPSWDSNLASLDKLPSFNHLCHHHGLSFYQEGYSKELHTKFENDNFNTFAFLFISLK